MDRSRKFPSRTLTCRHRLMSSSCTPHNGGSGCSGNFICPLCATPIRSLPERDLPLSMIAHTLYLARVGTEESRLEWVTALRCNYSHCMVPALRLQGCGKARGRCAVVVQAMSRLHALHLYCEPTGDATEAWAPPPQVMNDPVPAVTGGALTGHGGAVH